MRVSHNCSFSDRIMLSDSPFNLSSSQSMSRNIEHVIYSTCNPIITVFVPQHSITSHIVTREATEIDINKPFMITIDCPHDTWPCPLNTQISSCRIPINFVAFFIQNDRFNSKEWISCGTRFQWSSCR